MRKALIIALGLVSLTALVQSTMAEENKDCLPTYRACIRGAIELLYKVGGEAHDSGIQACLALYAYCSGIADDKPSKHVRTLNGGGNLKNFPGSSAGATAGSFTKAGGLPANASGITSAKTGVHGQNIAAPQRQNAVGNVLGHSGIFGADRPKLHAN
jgi:hypothetical protein